MALFMMGQKQKEQIQKVLMHAEANVVPLEKLMALKKGEANPVGDSPEFTVNIPIGIKAVFSYEMQPEPIGKCRHLSVSVSEKGRFPNPAVVAMIMKAFGFRDDIPECQVWIEEQGVPAVNVLEPCSKSLREIVEDDSER